MKLSYAGIGNRDTPEEALKEIRQIAGFLSSLGFKLRTGGGEGADENFLEGHTDRRTKKVFLPNPKFRGIKEKLNCYVQDHPSRVAMWLASMIHPHWWTMHSSYRFLMARNLDILADFRQVEELPTTKIKLSEANNFISVDAVSLVIFYERMGHTTVKKYVKGGTNFGLFALQKWKEAELLTTLPVMLNIMNPLDGFLAEEYAKEIKRLHHPKNLVVF